MLRQTDALLAAIIDSSDDAIISKDLNGVVTSWNRAAERIFGFTAQEAVGRPITMIIPPERLGEEGMILGRIRRGERVDHFETVRRSKDGRPVDVSVTISPIKDAKGNIVGASKVARDISGRKDAERIAERAKHELERVNDRLKEVDRLKSEFLASMSHELRTPLNSIIGFTGVLRQQIPGPLNEEQIKQLGMVANSARHLLHLVDEILDLSRIEAGRVEVHPEWLDLHELTADALRSLAPAAQRKSLALVNDVPSDLKIHSDRKLVLQVLLNLLSNAVKFTSAGQVKAAGSRMGDRAEIAISDTGIGIKAEQLPMLFEAFRQLEGSSRKRYEGTGLGLHLSRRLLELLGGSIRVRSEYGKGSEFTFSLPIERHEPAT